MGESTTVRALGANGAVREVVTGAVLRDLLARSRWYRLGFAAALLGAALDGWLSPAVIPNHPETGELNAVSLFHVLDGLAFASVRVVAVVAVALLVGVLVRYDGLSAWSHGAMALIAVVNYANGTIALSSGLAAAGGSELDPGHFLGGSLLTAGLTVVACLWLLARAPTTESLRSRQDRWYGSAPARTESTRRVDARSGD